MLQKEEYFSYKISEEQKDEGSLGAHSLGLAFTCRQRPHQLNNTHSMASEMLRDLCMGAICKLLGGGMGRQCLTGRV